MTPMTYTIEGAVQASGLPRTTIYQLLGTQAITAESLQSYLANLPAATIAAPKRAA